MEITREQFQSYEAVRVGGHWNMIAESHQAMMEAGLDRDTYLGIIKHYAELKERFTDTPLVKELREVFMDGAQDGQERAEITAWEIVVVARRGNRCAVDTPDGYWAVVIGEDGEPDLVDGAPGEEDAVREWVLGAAHQVLVVRYDRPNRDDDPEAELSGWVWERRGVAPDGEGEAHQMELTELSTTAQEGNYAQATEDAVTLFGLTAPEWEVYAQGTEDEEWVTDWPETVEV